jgi:hypothetical protein
MVLADEKLSISAYVARRLSHPMEFRSILRERRTLRIIHSAQRNRSVTSEPLKQPLLHVIAPLLPLVGNVFGTTLLLRSHGSDHVGLTCPKIMIPSLCGAMNLLRFCPPIGYMANLQDA